jgi:hypothetical protein
VLLAIIGLVADLFGIAGSTIPPEPTPPKSTATVTIAPSPSVTIEVTVTSTPEVPELVGVNRLYVNRPESRQQTEVRYCTVPEIKEVSCSAGTLNDLTLDNDGLEISDALLEQIWSELTSSDNFDSSLTLSPPAQNLIRQYTVVTRFEDIGGTVILRYLSGGERSMGFTFREVCEPSIVVYEDWLCTTPEDLIIEVDEQQLRSMAASVGVDFATLDGKQIAANRLAQNERCAAGILNYERSGAMWEVICVPAEYAEITAASVTELGGRLIGNDFDSPIHQNAKPIAAHRWAVDQGCLAGIPTYERLNDQWGIICIKLEYGNLDTATDEELDSMLRDTPFDLSSMDGAYIAAHRWAYRKGGCLAGIPNFENDGTQRGIICLKAKTP